MSAATDRGLRSHVAATAAIAAGFLAALVLVVLVGQQEEPAGQPAPTPTENRMRGPIGPRPEYHASAACWSTTRRWA